MSYRDYLEVQKKYVLTKKEARLAREERLKHPREKTMEPSAKASFFFPRGAKILFVVLVCLAAFRWFSRPRPVLSEPQSLQIGIVGTDEEFNHLRNWLESIGPPDCPDFTIEQIASNQELFRWPALGIPFDLLIGDQETVAELCPTGVLAPLEPLKTSGIFADYFIPFWPPRAFQKTMGWVLPAHGNTEKARQLLLLLQDRDGPVLPK